MVKLVVLHVVSLKVTELINIKWGLTVLEKRTVWWLSWSWHWEQSKSINSGCWLYPAPLGKHYVWKRPAQYLANDSQNGFPIFWQNMLLIISLVYLNLQQAEISSKEIEALQATQLSLIITLRTIIYWWLTKGQGICLVVHRKKSELFIEWSRLLNALHSTFRAIATALSWSLSSPFYKIIGLIIEFLICSKCFMYIYTKLISTATLWVRYTGWV